MPRAAKQAKIDPDGIYVAWQGGSCDIDGISYSVAEGERRRGSDPFVQAHPWLFVADGAVAGETPNAWDAIIDRRDAEQADVVHDAIVVHEPQPLQAEDVLALTRSIVVQVGAGKATKLVRYEVGDVFNARSELVAALPDAFEPSADQFTKRRR